jgi:hypothetical protein
MDFYYSLLQWGLIANTMENVNTGIQPLDFSSRTLKIVI